MHSVEQNILKQNNNNIWAPLNNASFGSFCVQIGQLLESQWVFEDAINFLFSVDFASKRQQIAYYWAFKDPLRIE